MSEDYTTINGWTKARMKAAIRVGNSGRRAVTSEGHCKYLTDDGNRCAVGCFIPDGHPGQQSIVWVEAILVANRDLRALMPLPDDAMGHLQCIHDGHRGTGDVRDVLDAWIDANVIDAPPAD